MTVSLYLSDAKHEKVYLPVVEEDIVWTTERRSAPGKLTFRVVNDDTLDFSEGSEVRLQVDDNFVFFGYVFSQRRDKDQLIDVLAYDQLRYLKNKDTYVYEGKTATEVIRMIADDFNLQVGTLEDTGYVIASRVEDSATLFDIIENALDLTLENNKEMYVLYDEEGKITLKSLESMKVKNDSGEYLVIDETSGENYEYTSSIDDNTYNQIKLTYENAETKKRDVYMTKDTSHINEWGILQYYDKLTKGENGQAKADALLTLYNAKTRRLRLTNVFGDCRVRAGSMVIVKLDLGDITLSNFMLVERARHVFQLDSHFMDLTLRGGEISG